MPATAYQSALTLLANREHSEQEIYHKLAQKDFPPEEIHQAIQTLIQQGYLSNIRFLEAYIHHRRQKGYGPLRIQAELITKGISPEMIDHHLDITDNAWLSHAEQVWQKRFKGVIPRDFKARAKQMRFLQYRGFTSEQIETLYS